MDIVTLPFKLGIGGIVGSGLRYMPWIHEEDACNMFIKCLEDETMKGPYNFVAPNIVDNLEFTKSVSLALDRPLTNSIESTVFSFLFKKDEGKSSYTILEGCRVEPKRMKELNFQYKFPKLRFALADLYL